MSAIKERMTAAEARKVELTPATRENPACLPDSLKAKKIDGRKRMSFLPKMCGNAFPIFENVLYSESQRLAPSDYEESCGFWEFVELSEVKTESGYTAFYCYPSSGVFESSNTMNYAEGVLDNQLFGLICSLFAINILAWNFNGELQKRFVEVYHALKDYFNDSLSNIIDNSEDPKEILEARLARNLLYKFLD